MTLEVEYRWLNFEGLRMAILSKCKKVSPCNICNQRPAYIPIERIWRYLSYKTHTKFETVSILEHCILRNDTNQLKIPMY